MTRTLGISILLNLGLLAGLVWALTEQRRPNPTPPLTAAFAPSKRDQAALTAAASETVPPAAVTSQRIRWSDLECTNNYRQYIANLRAIGCPEATVRDIVRGDAKRAFAWERQQLGLNGSGAGPWSRSREARLVASLLGEKPSSVAHGSRPAKSGSVRPAPQAGDSIAETARSRAAGIPAPPDGNQQVADVPLPVRTGGQSPTTPPVPSYPLFLQDVNWHALGFTPAQQKAIERVRQQFITDIGGPNQDPNDPAYLARWQKAQSKADDALRGSLGPQDYQGYLQQQYYAWYQPQVVVAGAQGEPLTINPGAFSVSP